MSERPWSDAEEAYRVRSGLPPWSVGAPAPVDVPARFRAAAEVADAQAAIQRVRDVLRDESTVLDEEVDQRWVRVATVLRALDGDTTEEQR